MITRAVLEAQRGLYEKGREEARAQISAFNGAIECIDNLLRLEDQYEQAQQEKEEVEE